MTTAEKIAAFRALPEKQIVEIVLVDWQSGPVYYASTLVPELFEGFPVPGADLDLRLPARTFQDVMRDSTISDDQVQLDLWDGDGALSDLAHEHGSGQKVEIFYWLPQVGLLLSLWWGHLQPPQSCDSERFRATASFGFRSSLLDLPRRAFYTGCQAMFGGLLSTQAEIDEGDCPYNRHIGGGTGLLDGLVPFTSCPRNRPACIARLGDDLSYLAFDTVVQQFLVSETKGPNITVTTRGNETNLKRSLRVVAGNRTVRDLDLLAYVVEPDTKHPEGGSLRSLWAISEGRNKSITGCSVNDVVVGFQHLNTRDGSARQPRTSFGAQVANYSGTSLFYAVSQGDFRQATPENLKAQCQVEGKADVRVYSDQTAFTEQYTQDRAWWLLECYRNKRWGLGYDVNRFVMQDWIDLSGWLAETVSFTDADGNHYTGTRSTFNAELIGRASQQQINDICVAGRIGIPYPDEGKIRVVPLRKVNDLTLAPVFTDVRGPSANICVDDSGKSTLTRTILSDSELPNRIVLSFDDEAHGNTSVPLTFESVEAQLAAGRAFGDTSRRAVEREYTAFGVTNQGEAGRLGNLLLDLGPLDDGGLKNNLRITFTTWYEFALEVKKYQVIKVISPQLTRYGFEYFRVRSIRRAPDLKVEISAQAYPVDYYELLEDATQPPPIPGVGGIPNPGGGHDGIPCDIGFTALQHVRDRIEFQLENC